MDRNVRALTIALLCVLAVSLAAATIADPQEPPGTGAGSGDSLVGEDGPDDRDGTSDGNGMDNPEVTDGQGSFSFGLACIPMLTSPAFGFGLLGFVLLVSFVGWRRDGLVPAIAIMFVMTTILFPAWLMVTDCDIGETDRNGGIIPEFASGPAQGGEAGGSGGGAESVFSAPVVLGVLFVIALLLAVVVFRSSGSDTPDESDAVEPEQTATTDEETLTAIGDVAGEAADRIEESVDVENEVYRAWHEMTTHLDVANPEASTPTEFAASAREAGMDERHVDTLTDLFQAVRYGGADATPDREDRAVDALRAIESTYGGDR